MILFVLGLLLMGLAATYWFMRREHCGRVADGAVKPDAADMLYVVGFALGALFLVTGAARRRTP